MASEPGVPPPLPADAGWTRLHPTTLIFATGARLYQSRGLLLPAGLAVVVSRGRRMDSGWQSWESWLAIPLLLLLLNEVIHYLTFRYRLDPHEIVTKGGLFWKNERHIPYARVQNIELVQHALHRLAGVAVVRLDTGTGAGAEATLTVLSLDAIEALRAAVRQGRLDVAAPDVRPSGVDERGRVLSALSVGDLALHGLLTGRGTVVIAAILGAIWQGQLDWLGLGRFVPSRDWLWGQVTHATPVLALELTALVLAVGLLFRLASAVWSVIKHFGFSLVARGPELFQSYGLITRVGQTIPQGRIQKLTVVEPLGMRWLRRATLNVDTAASAKEAHAEQGHSGRKVLVPIVPKAQVASLVRDVHPPGTIDDQLVDLDALAWQHVDPRAFRRLVRMRLIAIAILCTPLAVGIGWRAAALILAAGAALLVVGAWFDATRTAFAWSGEALIFRSGAWTRQTSLVRVGRAQVVTIVRSPFDRRWQMAMVSIDTAGASGGHTVAIPWLSDRVADSLYARLRHAASAG